jgi:hypothetical protein
MWLMKRADHDFVYGRSDPAASNDAEEEHDQPTAAKEKEQLPPSDNYI